MKKILLIILAATLIFCAFSFASFAEAPTETTDNAADTAETLTNPAQTDLKAVYDQVIGIVTNGEIWAKIGVTVFGIIVLIVSVRSCFGKITNVLNVIKELIAGKATKEDAEKAVKEIGADINQSVKETRTELDEKYARLEEKNTKMVAVISLITLQLIKSPNARTEIMKIISDTKEISGDVVEFVEQIEENIKEADALEPKPDTPALDKIVAEQEEPKKDNPIMMLN